jgi:hypothetical protein
MRLTVFNGSPRGKNSNTTVFLDHFLKGFTETSDNTYELTYLLGVKGPEKLAEIFANAETVLFAFPVYIDSMPAMVKDFFEALEPYCSREQNPSFVFLIQSGFPEANHLRALERYLEKLSRRLNCRYLGTIIKGGGECIRFMPKPLVKMIFQGFYKLGRSFGATGTFDKSILSRLAFPEHFSKTGLFVLKIFQRLGTVDAYWNKLLKANKSFERRRYTLSAMIT